MQEGRVLFIDDATLISPAVLAVAYPAMDGRREITVKAHKGEAIKAADGFYVVAGHNPGVHGAILTEALASRFSVQVKVSTDYDLARALEIDPRAIKRRPRPRRPQGQAARSAGHPSCANCSPTPRSPASSARTPPSPTSPASRPEEDRDAVAAAVAKAFGRTRGSPPSPSAASSNPPPRATRKGPPAMSATAAPAAPAPAAVIPPGLLAAPTGDWKTLSDAMTAEVTRDRRPPRPGRLRPRSRPGPPACYLPVPGRHPRARSSRSTATCWSPTPRLPTPPSPPTATATRPPGAP